jgi:drug/metabolite transporter (DMT)-like permease
LSEGGQPVRRALPFILFAGLCFSTLDATAKYLVQDHSLFLVVWARYAGQMLVTTPIAVQRGGLGFWRSWHLRVQLVRSLCLVVATACFFGGLRFLPLAEGTAVSFLAPMIALLLAYPVLGERPTRARWAAAIGGFVGILILVRPGGAVFHPATGLLLMAALANALYQLLTRKLPGDASHTTLFYSGLVGTVLLTAALPFVETPASITLADVLFLVVLGLLAGVGHWGLIIAFTRAPASLVAPFTYVGMVWATLYGVAIFGHLPDAGSFLGMAVIVASGVALMAHEHRLHRPGRRPL